MRWAALLRGVNVGGNRKLPMAELRAFVAGCGFGAVETLLASGNVVFAAEGDAASLERALDAAARERLGLATEWLVRSHAELAAVIAANPFPDAAGARPSHLTVTFHREPFPPALLGRLADVYAGPERLHAAGRELFIDHPEGIGTSMLYPALAKLKLPTAATARNWNTVTRLAAMTA